MSTFDFGAGLVAAHQHPNGGGWVADTASVDKTAIIGSEARVFGEARVSDAARVFGEARVYGKAQVYGKARVSGEARVSDEARVYGKAQVYGEARVITSPLVISGWAEWGTVTIFPNNNGQLLIAIGCRLFTYEQAAQHWKDREDRKATLTLVDCLHAAGKL